MTIIKTIGNGFSTSVGKAALVELREMFSEQDIKPDDPLKMAYKLGQRSVVQFIESCLPKTGSSDGSQIKIELG